MFQKTISKDTHVFVLKSSIVKLEYLHIQPKGKIQKSACSTKKISKNANKITKIKKEKSKISGLKYLRSTRAAFFTILAA